MAHEPITSDLQGIRDEHGAIRAAIVRIEIELDRLQADLEPPTEPWILPELVRSFRDRLRLHFEREEGGLLVAASGTPEDRRVAHQLHLEHELLSRRVERLADEIDSGFVPSRAVRACFDTELRRLISDLARHEAIEHRLMSRVLEGKT